MLSHAPLGLGSDMLDEVRVYLRLENMDDDPSLGAIMIAAISYAESFTGQILIRREINETRSVSPAWQRLSASPVLSVGSVTGIPAEGSYFSLNQADYDVRIDNDDGYVGIMRPGAAGRVEINYRAGLAENWSELPESLRLGILSLAGYLYQNRDGSNDAGPPAAVAALLRPWRRMRLTA